jgi:RNA ligase
MNYDFPQIETIEDVLDDINGYDEIRVMAKGDYTVINYAVAFEETFAWDLEDPHASSIRRECRGLIFNKEGKLISRPYHKFFNAGEKEETQLNKINLYEPHVVLEKLDGSMIRPIPTADGFVLATKAGVTDIAQQAEEFIADKPEYTEFIRSSIACGLTPIFEWCSRKNRIVIDYPEDQLILTAVRDTLSGTYVNYPLIVETGKNYGIPVVKAVDGLSVQNIELFVKQVREWEDNEGIVLRFDTGHMIKVKADDYILRHKSKESINQEKNVIQVVLDDAVDDMIPLLTKEDAERLKNFQKAFWDSVEHTAMDMNDLYNAGNTMYPDKKEFAVNFVQKMILPFHAPIMYAIRGGRPTIEVIKEMIRKSLTSQAKLNDNRWLWGNLDWNYSNATAGE